MIALLPNRLTLMQRIQDAARNGYTGYFVGRVSLQKWPVLEKKFVAEYEANLAKSTRSKRRSAGEAVTLVYACPPWSGEESVTFVLLVSDGIGRVRAREQLRELRSSSARLELDGYELVHDGVGWSWQMTRHRYQYWRDRIHSAAALTPARRSRVTDGLGEFDQDAERILDVLYHAPGFRLVRRQVGKLVAHLHAEWTRLRPVDGPKPRQRKFLPYVQRLPNEPNPNVKKDVA